MSEITRPEIDRLHVKIDRLFGKIDAVNDNVSNLAQSVAVLNERGKFNEKNIEDLTVKVKQIEEKEDNRGFKNVRLVASIVGIIGGAAGLIAMVVK